MIPSWTSPAGGADAGSDSEEWLKNADGSRNIVHGEWKTGAKDACEGERLHP